MQRRCKTLLVIVCFNYKSPFYQWTIIVNKQFVWPVFGVLFFPFPFLDLSFFTLLDLTQCVQHIIPYHIISNTISCAYL